MQLVENQRTTLRAIEKDETWLHEWIKEKPSRLGLGDIKIKQSEVTHYKNRGGRLDILAYGGGFADTYYEIEVMLGECDSDHGFRTLDYWARERVKNPHAKHIAVLVAEDLSGRYKTLIETLPQFLPFIGIEIRVLLLDHTEKVATIETFIVAQPDDLIIEAGDEPEGTGDAEPRDRGWWETKGTPTYLATVDSIAKFCAETLGPSRIDYSAQSYISLKKGRRCWLPMWPRANGAYIYIPGGEGGASDAPSDFFHLVEQKLAEAGLESPSWTFKYNGGANPIGFFIPQDRTGHSMIREILRDAYDLA